MARLFISCNNQDFQLGKKLERALIKHGHQMTSEVDARPAGRWEEQLLHALHRSDAFICLLTPNGLGSEWVVGQTGMAISCEYTDNMLVLPVCTPPNVPNFVAAFHCFWLTGTGSVHVTKLAAELDEAIVRHRGAQPPRIFISHRHKDAKVARKLIDLLKSAFHVKVSDIRCTSVPPYKLAVGSHSADSLQSDLIGAEIVMGILGPDTADSDYVLFELGAAWGLRTPTFPLRFAGATYEHVPEVLRERSSLSLEDIAQCLQLVEDVTRFSTIERKKTSVYGTGAAKLRQRADRLVRAAKAT